MRLAAYQMRAVAGDVTANLATIAEAAAQAARGGVELLVLPELAIAGYRAGDAVADLAEQAEGPQINRVASIATENGLAIVCGFAERVGDAVYNSASLVTPDGRRVSTANATFTARIAALFMPGNTPPAL